MQRRIAGTKNNPIIAILRSTKEIFVFQSPKEAAAELKLDQVTLNHALRASHGMRNRYRGYDVFYAHPDEARPGHVRFSGNHSAMSKAKMSTAKDAKKRPIVGIDDDGRVVCRFDSFTAARKAMSCHIGRVLKVPPAKPYRGLNWSYDDRA